MSINAGSLLSTVITPILRGEQVSGPGPAEPRRRGDAANAASASAGDVQCFGGDCYALAFGVPAALMVVALGECPRVRFNPAQNLSAAQAAACFHSKSSAGLPVDPGPSPYILTPGRLNSCDPLILVRFTLGRTAPVKTSRAFSIGEATDGSKRGRHKGFAQRAPTSRPDGVSSVSLLVPEAG